MKTPLELLAPAKNAEAGIAAINYGADAVYIGAPKFSARAGAANLLPDIEHLIRYAHRFHARVYAAFNTILYNHELDEARKLLNDLISIGIDAVIIQDMGILKMDLPPVEWHASTQSHNAEPEKIRFLERAGFSRIILARELTLEQIREIKKQTTADLEFFVHGALCVSMSGQCYMSLASGNRSGNRGVCAQPCRKLYELKDAGGKTILGPKHLLSLKDMDLSGHIPGLAAAGISSFKMEGRLKDLNYVKNITAYYRQKLDSFLSGHPEYRKSSSGFIAFDFIPDPAKSFSRGATSYFLQGRNKEITSFDTPKSAGEYIGKVIAANGVTLEIETASVISNNDGLTYFSAGGKLEGVKVNLAEGSRLITAEPVKIRPGTPVFRNHDHRFEEMLKNSRTRRKIGLEIRFEEIKEGYAISGTDEDGIELAMVIKTEKQLSDHPEKATALFREQLSRSGESDFEITKVAIRWEHPGFMPVSRINGIRRNFLEAFLERRLECRPKPVFRDRAKDLKWPDHLITYLGNVSNHLSESFYRECGVNTIEPALEITHEFGNKRLMIMKHCLKYQLGYCPKEISHKIFPWQEPLFLHEGGKKFRLEFDCRECKMNLFQVL